MGNLKLITLGSERVNREGGTTSTWLFPLLPFVLKNDCMGTASGLITSCRKRADTHHHTISRSVSVQSVVWTSALILIVLVSFAVSWHPHWPILRNFSLSYQTISTISGGKKTVSIYISNVFATLPIILNLAKISSIFADVLLLSSSLTTEEKLSWFFRINSSYPYCLVIFSGEAAGEIWNLLPLV